MDLNDARQQMDKALELLRQDIGALKTGRATPSLVESIIVEAYETKMPLVELAMISAPEANQLVITPFDQAVIKNIEKALSMDRNLGLAPVVEGTTIRLTIPPLTEERRKELVKVLGQKLESGRIMVRQVRGEKMREIRDAAERKELNEDEKFQLEQDLQKITDEFNQQIEEIGSQKTSELMAI